MSYKVVRSSIENIDILMSIYDDARKYMKDNGNPTQWGDSWPTKEKIIEDITNSISYTVMDEGNIIGVFALTTTIDKTYIDIREGTWDSNEPYVTIHRLAAKKGSHGIFKAALDFAYSFNLDMRIDTHKDNKKMIHLITKYGFIYRGLITPIEGGERLAFDLKNR